MWSLQNVVIGNGIHMFKTKKWNHKMNLQSESSEFDLCSNKSEPRSAPLVIGKSNNLCGSVPQ